MDLGLRNRVVLITGASEGMGRAISEGFASEGATVVMSARRKRILEDAASDIQEKTKSKIVTYPADVQSLTEIQNLVQFIIEKLGKIDVLVCNTGGPPAKNFSQIEDEEWDRYLNLNLKSFIRLSKEVIPIMRKQMWGRILYLTSVSVKQPIDGLIFSNVTRSGVTGLTKSLSNELAKYNILVNNVCPGYVQTDHVVEFIENKSKLENRSSEEIKKQYNEDIPLRRMGDPKEIANVFVFLASDKASYITGVSLHVDGGYVKGVF